MKRMFALRRLDRRCQRRKARSCCRSTIRRLDAAKRVNYLAQALAAFQRAVRAHRELIKLAPEQFDPVVVERLAREREERKLHDAEIAVVLAKVYGESVEKEKLHQPQNGNRCRNGAEKVQFSRRKEAAIERRLAEWELWLTLGHEAFDRHQRLRPHQWLSLTTVARLFDVASQLDRLAAGMKLQPGEAGKRGLEDHSVWARDMDADLRRAYGSKAGAAPSEMTPVEMPKPDNAGEAMCLL
jgi:hypothetical protein